MSIRLEKTPRTDGLGVKRWDYDLTGDVTLFVYDRSAELRAVAGAPFVLRVMDFGGACLFTGFAETKAQAVECAQFLARVADYRPPFKVVSKGRGQEARWNVVDSSGTYCYGVMGPGAQDRAQNIAAAWNLNKFARIAPWHPD